LKKESIFFIQFLSKEISDFRQSSYNGFSANEIDFEGIDILVEDKSGQTCSS
jgi:hypothetical protein